MAGAILELSSRVSAAPSRARHTIEQLRRARERHAQRIAVEHEKNRVADGIREERHDARAKAVCAGTFAERRRHRSEAQLRAERQELECQWELRRGRQRRRVDQKKEER
jgi:hypothetical protein